MFSKHDLKYCTPRLVLILFVLFDTRVAPCTCQKSLWASGEHCDAKFLAGCILAAMLIGQEMLDWALRMCSMLAFFLLCVRHGTPNILLS